MYKILSIKFLFLLFLGCAGISTDNCVIDNHIVYSNKEDNFNIDSNPYTAARYGIWLKKNKDLRTETPDNFKSLARFSVHQPDMSCDNVDCLNLLHEAQELGYKPAFYKEGQLYLEKGYIKMGVDKLLQATDPFKSKYIYAPPLTMLVTYMHSKEITKKQQEAITTKILEAHAHGQYDIFEQAVLFTAQRAEWSTLAWLLHKKKPSYENTDNQQTLKLLEINPREAYEIAISLIEKKIDLDSSTALPELLEHAQKELPKANLFRALCLTNGVCGFEKNPAKALALLSFVCSNCREIYDEEYTTILGLAHTISKQKCSLDREIFNFLMSLHALLERHENEKLRSSYYNLVVKIGYSLFDETQPDTTSYSNQAVEGYKQFLSRIYFEIPETYEYGTMLQKLLFIFCTRWYQKALAQCGYDQVSCKILGIELLVALHEKKPLLEEADYTTACKDLAYHLFERNKNDDWKRAYKFLKPHHQLFVSGFDNKIDALCALAYAQLLIAQDGINCKDAQQIFSNLTTKKFIHIAHTICSGLIQDHDYEHGFMYLDKLINEGCWQDEDILNLHWATLIERLTYYKTIKKNNMTAVIEHLDAMHNDDILNDTEWYLMRACAYAQNDEVQLAIAMHHESKTSIGLLCAILLDMENEQPSEIDVCKTLKTLLDKINEKKYQSLLFAKLCEPNNRLYTGKSGSGIALSIAICEASNDRSNKEKVYNSLLSFLEKTTYLPTKKQFEYLINLQENVHICNLSGQRKITIARLCNAIKLKLASIKPELRQEAEKLPQQALIEIAQNKTTPPLIQYHLHNMLGIFYFYLFLRAPTEHNKEHVKKYYTLCISFLKTTYGQNSNLEREGIVVGCQLTDMCNTLATEKKYAALKKTLESYKQDIAKLKQLSLKS